MAIVNKYIHFIHLKKGLRPHNINLFYQQIAERRIITLLNIVGENIVDENILVLIYYIELT